MKRFAVITISAALLLTACGGSGENKDTAPSGAAVTAVPATPTSTSTPTPKPTLTSTPSPTTLTTTSSTVVERAVPSKAAQDHIAEQAPADQPHGFVAPAQKPAEEYVEPPAPAPAAVQQAPAPVEQKAPAPAGNVVHPGAFCSGGTGVSSTGKPMVCAPAKDGRNRWKSA
ncbi:hypothetical protein QVA66_11025 [Staphylococcus chromogenes]|nr:hypothetical protein [Staphylococcus chromogenes]